MDLSIVIVNYNTSYLLQKCVESIFNSDLYEVKFEIIIVDNNSKDDSYISTTSKFPEVKWIQQNYNSGFSRANNAGIYEAKGKYLLFLNSDIVLQSNTIIKCLDYIQSNAEIGVLSCKLLNDDGSVQRFESTIASFRKYLDYNLVINYFFPANHLKQEAVMGAFMLIPKEVILTCGNFDPDFFFFSEVIELCNRVKNKNYSIKILDEVTAFHKGSGSNTDRTWANRQAYLSLSLMFLKIKSYWGFYLLQKILIFNLFVNFFAMWFLDKSYRQGYFKDINNYFNVFVRIMQIPFLYSTKMGNGKRLLKY